MTLHVRARHHAGAVCPANRGKLPLRSLARSHHSSTDKLVSWFLQLSLLAVWKSLTTLSAPVARVLAVYVWAGKSVLKICSWATRLVLKLTGWLGSPAFPHSKWVRQWSKHMPWPLDVRKWHVVVAMFVTASLVNSMLRKWRESFDDKLRQLRLLQDRMAAATSYAEWREFAQQLDRLGHARGGDVTGHVRDNLYDSKLLQQKLGHLQTMRHQGNVREMMFSLRTDLLRNIANIAKSQLHEHYYEVPAPIREYIQEVKAQLAMLTDWPDAGLDMEEKLSFFRETRHAFGRTALLLSGGGGLGSFHIGVVKALFEHRMLPRVLAGSSVGSIVAGLVATRTDDELRETFRKLDNLELSFFNNSRAVELVHSFLQKGALHDMSFLQRKLKSLIGNYTFLEAYERTGRILNVSVCPADTNEPARLLNYLTAPQALIWSAVAASSAFPGLFHPQDLLARNARGEEVRFSVPSMSDNISRRWRDGSLELDLPTFLLSEMFNCNHFIVSQTNPHIVPLLNLKKSLSRRWANLLELELRHRCAQLKWVMPEWFPTKWVSLFTQPWEGDITLVLPSHMWNLGKSIVNPTTNDILSATRQGELAIWEKLSAIETNCTIEATLDACLARLTNKARERPLNGLSSRIPSWLSMSTIGQQAVASWGNPLEAGTSPGNCRPWGSYPKGGSGVLAGGTSWGHLPAVVQAQQVAAAAAAAAAAVRESGSSGTLAPGLMMGPGGCVAATAAEQQRQQEAEQQQAAAQSHYGSDLPMSPTGSCTSSGSHGSSNAPSTSLEDGPATISEAMAAMANAANMGGLHSGYSYTAPALHHAHVQQHGNSPRHNAHSPPGQQQQGGTMGAGQLPGGLSTAFARYSSSSGGGSGSPAAARGGLPVLLTAAGSLGSQGLSVPATIHENMPDDKPRRVASWGTNDIADSVSDFPSGSSVAAAAAAADAAAAAVAAAYHARRGVAHSAPKPPGKGLLVRLFNSQSLLEEEEGMPSGSGSSAAGMAADAAAAAHARASAQQQQQCRDSRRSSLDSTEAHAPSEVLGELDCCDASVLTDIWSSLLPLATSAMALQAATDGTQGLDFIAP